MHLRNGDNMPATEEQTTETIENDKQRTIEEPPGPKTHGGGKADDKRRNFFVSWRTCIRLGVTVFLIFVCMRFLEPVENFISLLFGGLLAVFAGLVIAYIVNIPMRFFERKLPGPTGDGTKNRGLSMLLAFACIVGVVLVVLILVIPNLINAIIVLAESLPNLITNISDNEVLASIIPADIIKQLESINWEQVTNDVVGWLQSGIMDSLPGIMSAIGKIGACFMGIILSFWFLGEKDNLSSGAHNIIVTYIGKGADEKLRKVAKYADESFHGYIVGAALEGAIFGFLVVIGCTIAGIPEALMLGALVGVMSLIPVIGALIGAVLGAIIIFATSWQKALIFLVVFFVVQQIEQNVFYPRVVGKRAGLTGLWPLIGTTLGLAVFGFVGALVGVPLMATILRIVNADVERRKELDDENKTLMGKLQKSLTE